MYKKYSDATQMAMGKTKESVKHLVKKKDTDALLDMYRYFETSSLTEAALAVVDDLDPELATEISRHEKENDVAKGIHVLSGFIYLQLTMAAASLFRWMKTNGYYGSTLLEAIIALWEYEPVLEQKLLIAIHNDKMFDESAKIVVTRAQWMNAIRLCLVQLNPGSAIAITTPPKVVSPTFSLFYSQVLICLYYELRYERELARPAKAKHTDESEVYLSRIDMLTKQIDTLRQENDRLIKKDRKDLDSVVAPLERAIQDRDSRIEELEEENKVLREIQVAISEQEEYTEALLPLPEDDVLFVGGSPQLRTKVQARFPGWKVVAPEEFMKIFGKNQTVFLYTDYISHKITNMVRKHLTTNPCYCHGTNMEQLEKSMQVSYTMSKR